MLTLMSHCVLEITTNLFLLLIPCRLLSGSRPTWTICPFGTSVYAPPPPFKIAAILPCDFISSLEVVFISTLLALAGNPPFLSEIIWRPSGLWSLGAISSFYQIFVVVKFNPFPIFVFQVSRSGTNYSSRLALIILLNLKFRFNSTIFQIITYSLSSLQILEFLNHIFANIRQFFFKLVYLRIESLVPARNEFLPKSHN
jgi:hypothetical protein